MAEVMAKKVSLKSLTIDKMSKLSLKPDSKFCNEEPIAFLDDPMTAAMMQPDLPRPKINMRGGKLSSDA